MHVGLGLIRKRVMHFLNLHHVLILTKKKTLDKQIPEFWRNLSLGKSPSRYKMVLTINNNGFRFNTSQDKLF